ncbi:precorrin-8X methylmutase [bacterium]|nr:precorrin-8X methylmutase [bacterium]
MKFEKDPTKIESMSMEIIDRGMKPHNLPPEELAIVKRMIHTSGDFDYQEIVNITPGAIESGINAINSGCSIVTDTKMAMAGINKTILAERGCAIYNYVDHEEVFKISKASKITRSMAAIDFALSHQVDIFVIGNAPTALFRLGELIEEKKLTPKLIVAVPVGFVGAAESKEYIRTLDVPTISTVGTKGGSNIAAAVINALLYMRAG